MLLRLGTWRQCSYSVCSVPTHTLWIGYARNYQSITHIVYMTLYDLYIATVFQWYQYFTLIHTPEYMAVLLTQVGATAAEIASAYEHIAVLIQLVEYMEQRPAPPPTEQQQQQPPPPPTTGQPPAEPGPTTEQQQQQQQQQPAERVRLCIIYVMYICNHVVSE